jgi:hypothetical protein
MVKFFLTNGENCTVDNVLQMIYSYMFILTTDYTELHGFIHNLTRSIGGVSPTSADAELRRSSRFSEFGFAELAFGSVPPFGRQAPCLPLTPSRPLSLPEGIRRLKVVQDLQDLQDLQDYFFSISCSTSFSSFSTVFLSDSISSCWS